MLVRGGFAEINATGVTVLAERATPVEELTPEIDRPRDPRGPDAPRRPGRSGSPARRHDAHDRAARGSQGGAQVLSDGRDEQQPPLILTLALDGATFAPLDALRRPHFPPERNLVPAHLTLFHALPGAERSRSGASSRELCRAAAAVRHWRRPACARSGAASPSPSRRRSWSAPPGARPRMAGLADRRRIRRRSRLTSRSRTRSRPRSPGPRCATSKPSSRPSRRPPRASPSGAISAAPGSPSGASALRADRARPARPGRCRLDLPLRARTAGRRSRRPGPLGIRIASFVSSRRRPPP